ncbi:DUF192 domain-containing protein [Rhizobium rosettiformans]|uniref:DUF192 domain-containing protein n=2 Tax=Rhizobium/Agrobacterium group TaxID=227290 RepID=A0ABX7EY51_9HYPH|nr:DUF192 domain-containing protein [Rhizobium rosettiformans]
MVPMPNLLRSALAALLLFFAPVASAMSDVTFERGQLAVETTAGGTITIDVEWALTAEQRARGLMERPPLPDRTGMLFDFGDTRMVTMWMANTPSSLDMIFIDETGRIVRIAERTTPLSESIVSSGEPVRYALEIRGGHAAELGLDTSARLVLPLDLPK